MIRKIAQDDRAQHAEDGRIGTDAEPQRQHGNGRKPGVLGQAAEGHPKIADEAAHVAMELDGSAPPNVADVLDDPDDLFVFAEPMLRPRPPPRRASLGRTRFS